ncbi:MAG: HEAT repeat domain-containing protein [Phycisphaerae bacterium]
MKKSSLARFLVVFSVVQFCLLGFPRNSMPGEGAALPVHPPHRDTNVDIGFDMVSIDIEAFRGPVWSQVEHIRVSADGLCEYRIDELPARGDDPRRPSARLVHNLDKKRLQQLQELLQKTAWLTAPGWEGRAMHTHPTTYTITIVRDGKEHTIICHGERPEPYKSLIWFFLGITHQENLLYQLTRLRLQERLNACSQIRSDVEALSGKAGRMYPLWDLDYTRYQDNFIRVLSNLYSQDKDEIITAIKLLVYLGVESARDDIARLGRDLDDSVRNAAAKALGDLDDKESIPLLAELIDSTDEAGWSLIRLGQAAVPTIVQIIERGTLPNDLRSERLVRTYIEHWEELPGPIDPRVVAAVRKAITTKFTRDYRTEYHKRFLELAENQPVPSGPVLCRLDYLVVKCVKPLRFIHGWYTVVDRAVVEHGAGPAPDAGTELFRLVAFKPNIQQNSLHIRTGWQPMRANYGTTPLPIITNSQINVADGTELKIVYTYYQRRKLANYINPVRIAKQYKTLWEAYLLQDGRPTKRILYVARVTEPNDPMQAFVPPETPAPARGKLPEPRPQISFRGVELTEDSLLSDHAVLHDLQVAWKNYVIKNQGRTPTDISKTVVVYESSRQKEPIQHILVFNDPEQNAFYIQVRLQTSEGKRFEYHGPFEGDPTQVLGL